MTKRKQQPRPKPSTAEATFRLHALQGPDVQESLERLQKRYGKYAVSADKVRAMLDKVLGDRTLTEELYELRGHS